MEMTELIRALLMITGYCRFGWRRASPITLCHRASAIEETSGPKESLFHIAQLSEVGIGLLAVLSLK
jgi:hypothetical protein